MKIIVGRRRSGKTYESIKLSAKTGASIVCTSQAQADFVQKEAAKLGISIPTPIALCKIGQLQSSKFQTRKIILDDIQGMTDDLLKFPVLVEGITINLNPKEDEIILKGN